MVISWLRYDGDCRNGYDIALIAIPETPASEDALNFNLCEQQAMPKSIFVNGYPMIYANVITYIKYFFYQIESY